MRPMGNPKNFDVAIVGAGPIGSAAALAFAQRGAKVVLFEANPGASRRLAGEWLHPPGVDVLGRLGIHVGAEAEGATVGRGFVVFPDDGSAPIMLPYPDGMQGVSLEHENLVTLVRERASVHPNIDLRLGARVRGVVDGTVTVDNADGAGGSATIEVDRVVGADGRSSVVRRTLALKDEATAIAYTAGVELRDVQLPFEGYGHVIVGGPGPVLMYRIDSERVRACFDVPLVVVGRLRRGDPEALWDTYRYVLPAQVVDAFRKALDEKRVQWAAAGFRPRAHYGRGKVALAGDAVGYFHPMTAAGLSLGLADAECVAESPDVASYRRHRDAKSWVPELLACALYLALTRRDPSGVAVRQAVYRLWRGSKDERGRTMRILACADTRPEQFVGAFQAVLWDLVREDLLRGWRTMPGMLMHLGGWMRWPVASIVPRAVRRVYRARSSPAFPLWGGPP
jgi:2-polyprenyl-6-methoxyphenol hydroxylase-like FAD-dependent oxidoreductase